MNFTKSFLNGKFVGFKKGAGFETCPTNGIQFQLERLSLPRLLWTAQNILRIARQGFCAHTVTSLRSGNRSTPYRWGRLVFVVDATTDKKFLEQTFERTCRELQSNSPNWGVLSSALQPVEFKSQDYREFQNLLKKLCASANADNGSN